MQIIARGRNVEVPDHFRDHVEEKLTRLERYDGKIISLDVELHHERNPRQTDNCQRVEITCRTRGPVIRAEACADDFYKALDLAVEKIDRRMRHAADRRRHHHGRRAETVRTAMPDAAVKGGLVVSEPGRVAVLEREVDEADPWSPGDDALPGRIVREKDHPATPMSVDQALEQMELVGHDFFLFCDEATGRPSVVYRRHAFDYGLLRLT
jgi:ribosomal subunit interface protein